MEREKAGSEDWAITAARQFAASASGRGLAIPVEAVAEVFRQIETIDVDLSGIERVYNTEEAAQFFGKSPQWMYWAMRSRDDGSGGWFYYALDDPDHPPLDPENPEPRPIEPERHGKKGIRRFNLEVIQNMAVSLYQKGGMRSIDQLQEVVRRVQLAKTGRWAPEPPKKTRRKRKTKAKASSKNGSVGQGPA